MGGEGGGAVFQVSDEPLLFALIDGFGEGWVIYNDGCIGTIRWLRPLGFVSVVGTFVMEHVTDHKHQDAQDGEQHCRDDAWKKNS